MGLDAFRLMPPDHGNGDHRESTRAANRRRYRIILGCIFVVGAYLRLHLLSSQILLDDEWHSIRAVTGKTLLDVLTGFDPVNNSSLPLNLYNLALYHTIGWSELTIRLPIILAGLVSLVALPLQIKQVFNERVSIAFACLLAISPFLVFYSRYDRPYGLTTLFCFSALLFSHQWLSTGKLAYAVGFVVTGLLAIYSNLLSIVAVATPFVACIGFGLLQRLRPSAAARPAIKISFKTLFQVAAIFALFLLPYLWPVLRKSAELPWASGRLTLHTVQTAATLLSGTTCRPLNLIFFMLLMIGFIDLLRNNLLLGSIFVATICAYVALLLISRPLGMDEGAILLRYMIVVVPMSLAAVAVAVDGVLKQIQNLTWITRPTPTLCASLLLACLFAAGPLLALNVPPNNLANHAFFQTSYEAKTWQNTALQFVYPSFVIRQDEIPPFYNWLGGQSNVSAIIEYPFDLCSYNNLFYFYQHFHRKRILAGYCNDPTLVGYTFAPLRNDQGPHCRVGKMDADEILSNVKDPSKLAFRNMIDVTDATSVLSSPADFLILHKDIMAQLTVWGDSVRTPTYDWIRMYYQSADRLQVPFRKEFGQPVYEDAHMVCFQIKRPK
ncbi:MAG TPA: glycosyltransferase family 39 protein [Verrucomicrobiae bacterium]|nr:glycosyltransferase family 39 protein [Verrucomicrobiae bacterium]